MCCPRGPWVMHLPGVHFLRESVSGHRSPEWAGRALASLGRTSFWLIINQWFSIPPPAPVKDILSKQF